MDRVTVRLVGGLGNYMFEIAAAYNYGRKYNKEVIISTQNLFTPQQHFDRYLNTIFEKIKPQYIRDISTFRVYKEPSFNYSEIPFIEGDVLLEGHFQSEKYFEESKDFIRELFTCERKALIKTNLIDEANELTGKSTCSIHVRRGDYLQHTGCLPVTSTEWYSRAINLFPIDTIFTVFSDDKEWIRENFTGNFLLADPSTDYDDMLIMSLCNNNIICNSTFGWWGAWLNNNMDKKVVAPTQWFGPECIHYNTKDLIPSTWIILP